MFARPVTTNVSSYGPPGFVLEVDRYGGTIRTNIEDEFVVATNHFIEYGVNEETDPSSDKYSPWLNFNVPVVSPGSTSWWRHETVLNAVRSKVRVNKMTADFENAKRNWKELYDENHRCWKKKCEVILPVHTISASPYGTIVAMIKCAKVQIEGHGAARLEYQSHLPY